MSDENERSVASAGSVAGEPVAWAVIDDGGMWFTRVRRDDALEAYRRAVVFCEETGRIVPLYRSPALSDAEQDAIEGAIIHMETRGVWAWPATLRGLLERLGKEKQA